MISINLLPPEYRRSEATPIARFLAIVIGAVVVTTALVIYGWVHYSKLRGIREVREATDAEFTNKKARADVSRSLQSEINAYEARRKAIQEVAKNRILQSRKLDEFLAIMHNRGDKMTYNVWLQNLTVKPPRAARRGSPTSGGSLSFGGFSESREFSRVTNLRDAIKKAKTFYLDFQGISRPVFKAIRWDDELEPNEAGKFAFDLTLKPLGWAHSVKKKG
ncbi:MAG: PilN domain-containing protein [Planctomycetota bacterium]